MSAHAAEPTDSPPAVDDLVERQDGVVRLDQLLVRGWTRAEVAADVASRRWQRVGPSVVVAHNGPLTAAQVRWAVVLNAGPRASLCAQTAAALHGLRGWEDDQVHVLVQRGDTPPDLPGLAVVVHESRRYDPGRDRSGGRVVPMTRPERSVLDAATWLRSPRRACGLVVAACQQRVTSAPRLGSELSTMGLIRHCRILRLVLGDVAGGAQALSEVDFARLCRRHGLPAPEQQVVRTDHVGRRRYVDAQFRGRGGRMVDVEVDGSLHLVARTYWDDMARANELVIAGDAVLRFPTIALYLDERTVVDQLRRMLDGG